MFFCPLILISPASALSQINEEDWTMCRHFFDCQLHHLRHLLQNFLTIFVQNVKYTLIFCKMLIGFRGEKGKCVVKKKVGRH